MSARPRISVLINTCNEGQVLRDCLKSIDGWADEIVICDMESSDDTLAVAEAHDALIWSHPRMPAPEPEARIFGIGKCSGEWVFILDPDMRLSPMLRARLDQIVSEDAADVVEFYCRNFYFTRWCAHGHGSQPVVRKFFKRQKFKPVDRNIQTFWHDSLSGCLLTLPREYSIEHYAYRTVWAMAETLTRYARKEAADDFKHGRRFSLPLVLWRPLKRFVGNYILRLGFLDGMPGLIISVGVSWYLFLIEVFIWESTAKDSPGGPLAKA
jgi:(heptosyl)LPS beta-1,4-glucosyltransferase